MAPPSLYADTEVWFLTGSQGLYGEDTRSWTDPIVKS